MDNTKTIIAHTDTGATVYCIVERDVDGYLLNDADGAFASAPADPYVSLTEHTTIKGRYDLDESRTAWNDGRYIVTVYKQAGGSPAPVSDTVVGEGELFTRNDSEVYLDALPSFLHKWILNRLVVSDTEIILYDDDDTTVLNTWSWDGLSKTRGKAT